MTGRIIVVAQTCSTNEDMAALADGGAGEGLWLRAERQTGGRGRGGRLWSSESGNLYISTLVRRRPTDPAPHTLALVAAVAAHATVEALLPDSGVTIKWPNDLMIDAAKLCGMLLEARGDAIIVGIGMNVAHAPDIVGRETSCLAALGAPVGCTSDRVAQLLAERFALWLTCWREQGLDAIRNAWLRGAHPSGTALRAMLPDGQEVEGAFAGLAADGALLLTRADGGMAIIHAGDVFAL